MDIPRCGAHTARNGSFAQLELVFPTSLQAIILAAGRGSRLEAETDETPKCLVDVGDGRLIDHQIDTLQAHGIEDILVVAGYRASDVKAAVRGRAHVIINPEWGSTNSLYSLALCKPHVRGGIVVMNCDVLAHIDALGRLLATQGSAFAYDSVFGTDDEQMKVQLRNGHLSTMCKRLSPDRSHGENVGILRFEAYAAQALFVEAEAVLAEGGNNAWMAEAVERVAQYMPLRAVDVADLPWIEIDFPDDLATARELLWPRLQRWPRAVHAQAC